jgi:NO-binding membrane sensor protein with MHYT domain
MLQRIQSVWLLLVAAFDLTTFRFPFYSGDWSKDQISAVVDLNARTEFWLSALSAVIGVLAFITIFIFKNRKQQLRLTYLGILLTAGLLALYFVEMSTFLSGNIALWCLFYFAMLVSYIFAARGIKSDERLIRSMDRLR